MQRLAQRLGWTRESDPKDIEVELCKLLPKDAWDITSHTLIFHGRRTCFAQKPQCDACGIASMCPSAGRAELVGRKPPRAPR